MVTYLENIFHSDFDFTEIFLAPGQKIYDTFELIFYVKTHKY